MTRLALAVTEVPDYQLNFSEFLKRLNPAKVYVLSFTLVPATLTALGSAQGYILPTRSLLEGVEAAYCAYNLSQESGCGLLPLSLGSAPARPHRTFSVSQIYTAKAAYADGRMSATCVWKQASKASCASEEMIFADGSAGLAEVYMSAFLRTLMS